MKTKEPTRVHPQEVILLKRNHKGQVVTSDDGKKANLQAAKMSDYHLLAVIGQMDRQEQAFKDGTLVLPVEAGPQ